MAASHFFANTILRTENEEQKAKKTTPEKKTERSDVAGATDKQKKQPDFSLAKIFRQLVTSLDENSRTLERSVSILRDIASQDFRGKELQRATSQHESSQAMVLLTRRKEKIVVELKLTFMKIGDIDTVIQMFEAEMLVRAKWQDPLLDETDVTTFDADTMWTPHLQIMNLEGSFSLDKMVFRIIRDAPGYRYPLVVMLWRFKGFYRENLELQHFPIDVQDLTISVTSERSDLEIDLVEDRCAVSSVNTKTFQDAQEWDIYKHVETYKGKTTMEFASESIHPIFHAQCRVKRKMGYFMWNIVFIVALITVLTFATFSIEPSSADRLAVTITLLLTSVTFKLIVKQSLPTISYLTYLDLYVLSALIFLGITSTQHAIIRYLSNFLAPSTVYLYDIYSIGLLFIIFFLFHVIFGIFIFVTAVKRRHQMFMKDRVYKEKRARVEKDAENARTERAIQKSVSKTEPLHV